jgi:hypothetical protein
MATGDDQRHGINRDVVPDKVDRWTKKFLRVLRLTGKVNAAAKAAGRTVGHVYHVRAHSERFRNAWETALAGWEERKCDTLESEAYRRAVKGVRDVYVSGGRVVTKPGTEIPIYKRRYSDSLMAKLLEANLPEKYGKRSDSQVNVTVSLTSPALQSRMTDPEYRRAICDQDAAIAAPRTIDVTERSEQA